MINRNQKHIADAAMLALDRMTPIATITAPFLVHKHNEQWWFFDDCCVRIGPFESSLEAGAELHLFQEYLKQR